MGILAHVDLVLPQGCHPPVYGYVLHRTFGGHSTGHVTPGHSRLMVILTCFFFFAVGRLIGFIGYDCSSIIPSSSFCKGIHTQDRAVYACSVFPFIKKHRKKLSY